MTVVTNMHKTSY